MRSARFHRWSRSRQASRVLVIVQNMSVPLDRRVWLECQALVSAGHQVSVICPRGANEPKIRQLDGVWIYTYPPAPPTAGVLSYLSEFSYCWLRTALLSLRVMFARGFDVIQACNPPDTYWALALLYKPFGKRFVYDQHDLCPEIYEARFKRGGPLHRLLLLLERATYAVADEVISTNESYREIALTRGRLDPGHLTIVRSCPDPARMRRGEAHPALRHGREHLACYLGIMGPQDGVDRLVRAVAVYVHQMGRRDCHFALMGYGDCLEELKALVHELGLEAWVMFTGRVEPGEIARWLSTADLGLSPDPMSPFNDKSTMNKTLEYMAYGLPVLAYDLHETRRSAGEAAEYVSVDDDAAYAKGIAALLDDPERRALLGQAGRRRIEEKLSWQSQAPHYVGVYERLARRDQEVQPSG